MSAAVRARNRWPRCSQCTRCHDPAWRCRCAACGCLHLQEHQCASTVFHGQLPHPQSPFAASAVDAIPFPSPPLPPVSGTIGHISSPPPQFAAPAAAATATLPPPLPVPLVPPPQPERARCLQCHRRHDPARQCLCYACGVRHLAEEACAMSTIVLPCAICGLHHPDGPCVADVICRLRGANAAYAISTILLAVQAVT